MNRGGTKLTEREGRALKVALRQSVSGVRVAADSPVHIADGDVVFAAVERILAARRDTGAEALAAIERVRALLDTEPHDADCDRTKFPESVYPCCCWQDRIRAALDQSGATAPTAKLPCPECGDVDRENRWGHRDGCRYLSRRANTPTEGADRG